VPHIEESKYSSEKSFFHRDYVMTQGSSISQVFGFVLNDGFGSWEGQAMHANT
jgi:hypothetical protein